MRSKELVLRHAKARGAVEPRVVKGSYAPIWRVHGAFGSHGGETEAAAWESAARSLDDYRPGEEKGYRAAMEWVLGELAVSLGELQPGGVNDYDDGGRDVLGELKKLIDAKLEGLGEDGER